MSSAQPEVPPIEKPLRLWPGVAAAVLQWLGWLVVPAVVPEWAIFGMLGAAVFGLVIIVWWLFFSRAPWLERLGVVAFMVVAVAATSRLVHESVANGFQGLMPVVYGIPAVTLALVAGAMASRGRSRRLRRASMVAAILLACAALTLVRTGGITGEADSDLHWRWTPTPEERLLAQAGDEFLEVAQGGSFDSPPGTPLDSARVGPLDSARGKPMPSASDPAVAMLTEERSAAEREDVPAAAALDAVAAKSHVVWPGFRGPNRDSIITGVRIDTDWRTSPPVEVWRRPIGPGWSSFAVHDDLLYTQEQRGDDEIVAAYRVTTGEPVWGHRDMARFWESNGGAGPRATPTLSNGRVYTFGATGIVNALDAGTGAVLWSRNAATDTGVDVPGWGFASSPLAIDDLVIVAASGQLVAYDAASGDPRWLGPKGGAGYSSPHLVTIDGVPQVLLLRGSRTISVAPADGTLLWEHIWQPGVGIVQPAKASDDDLLITVADISGFGMRRLRVADGPAGWTVEERWTSRALKPYFNDYVVHENHVYGFDGSILACVDLADGARKWKGGRYGHGQMLLLADQDVLLVLSEDGDLALVEASPGRFIELARLPAIEGKTWNHPVLVGDVLLVRNDHEMAAFRLSLAGR